MYGLKVVRDDGPMTYYCDLRRVESRRVGDDFLMELEDTTGTVEEFTLKHGEAAFLRHGETTVHVYRPHNHNG